jgi:hypothetical protein|tara:strand:- start:11859 stop:12362 length:504 start_codon:yes stop_codon:yes gene_type:complete
MKVLLSFLLLLASLSSVANESTHELIKRICNTNDVDTSLIVKIITHESKSYFNSQAQPWPWTLNINGQGYYFDSYSEALAYAKKALESNPRRFGVGIGQIEWSYHKTRFKDISEALNPIKNLQAVRDILLEGRRVGISNSYELAAYYHRPKRDSIAFKYADKVFSND